MEYITDFMNKMDKLFASYAADNCMDGYKKGGNAFYVGEKDACYMWAALDGAIHLYNIGHPQAHLCLGDEDCMYVIERAE